MLDLSRFHSLSEPVFTKKLNTNKTLVLDLDDTLIHSKKASFESGNTRISFRFEGEDNVAYICPRPGLEDFLSIISKYYTLILFTSAIKAYSDAVIRELKIGHYFSGFYHRGHCQENYAGKMIKDLSIFEVEMSNILLVDDSAVNSVTQAGNILILKPFAGDLEDRELLTVAEFLIELSKKQDVRPVMEGYTEFKLQDQLQASKIKKIQTLRRGFNSKFLQQLNISTTGSSTVLNQIEDCDFEGTEENFSGASTFRKLPIPSPDKPLVFMKKSETLSF